MNIQTDRQIKVWARDGQYGKMYSIGISEKQQDGTYKTSYVPVKFRKEVNLDNEQIIYVRSGWLKPTKDNGIAIFINEFEKLEETIKNAKEEFVKSVDKVYLEDIDMSSDLPF